MDKSRQQFEEKVAEAMGLDISEIIRHRDGDKYQSLTISVAWHWWQASRESLDVELPEPFIANENCEIWCYDEDLVNQALIRNGVKIKNE